MKLYDEHEEEVMERLDFKTQFVRFAVFYGRSILCQSFITFMAVVSCFYYVIEVRTLSFLYLSAMCTSVC